MLMSRAQGHQLSTTDPDLQLQTDELIRSVWERNLPTLRGRLDLLERVGDAATHGRLPAALRSDAARVAHNLAGSLGMFGFPVGTAIARKLECVLSDGDLTLPQSKLVYDLTCELRKTLAL